jgi:hypothetical protein
MEKLIVLAMIMAVMLLGAVFPAPAHAQTPANDLKPTFISPTPGLYVNGWPAFTVSYPKEWVEAPPLPGVVLQVGAPRPDLRPSPVLYILVFANPLPLEDWAKIFMPVWVELMTDIKIVSDKPSQLKDGTPAREVEYEGVAKNGPKISVSGLLLATKKDMAWVSIIVDTAEGKPGKDVKGIAYSLTFQPDREEPVQVPPDVRAFLDMYCTDIVSRDVTAIMAHYSDRFLDSGMSKAFAEQWWRNDPTSPIHRGVISDEATVTVFEPHGDKAYIDGFFLGKAKGDGDSWKVPMGFQQIINEHGQWKWFGNQK